MSSNDEFYTAVVRINRDTALKMIERDTALKALGVGHDNRPISRAYVSRYARDMVEGNWKMNADPIRVTKEGRIIDGQHRLHTVVLSNAAVDTLVAYNLPFEVFDTIDCGNKRTAGHVLSIKGEKHYNHLSAACRLLLKYDKGDFLMQDNRITSLDIQQVLDKHPGIRESVEFSASRYTKLLSIGMCAAMHYIFSNIDPEAADKFINSLTIGEGLSRGDPILLLRKRLVDNVVAKAKLPRVYVLALIIKAWNAYRLGKKVTCLRFTTEGGAVEQFPTPV